MTKTMASNQWIAISFFLPLSSLSSIYSYSIRKMLCAGFGLAAQFFMGSFGWIIGLFLGISTHSKTKGNIQKLHSFFIFFLSAVEGNGNCFVIMNR